MSIVRIKKSREYFAASNIPFNDKRLSWEARGMIGYLLSKPDDWTIRFTDLEKQSEAGGHKVRRILKELETAGYLERKRMKNQDGTFYWLSTIYETPTIYQLSTCGLSIDGLSIDGLSIDGKPRDIENTDLISTELPKTDKQNTDEEKSAFSFVQACLEKTTGLPATGQGSIEAIKQIVAMEATKEDIEAAYEWYRANTGKPLKYYGSLVNSIRTAQAKRVEKTTVKVFDPSKTIKIDFAPGVSHEQDRSG